MLLRIAPCVLALPLITSSPVTPPLPAQRVETAAAAEEPLTAEVRRHLVEQLADELEGKYVFPKVGQAMADSALEAVEAGAYDGIETRAELARVLTDQLMELCADKHFAVRAEAPPAPGEQQRRTYGEQLNNGFLKAEYLPGGIGYLKFDAFIGGPEAEASAAAAMNFLANSRALVFDLRENGGGSPEMIAFLTTYLFDERVHLNSFYNRPADETTESWTREEVPGRRLGTSVPVFVLTSDYTFSGAEEFAYNLKHLKRGTLVGEVTGGGAHPVMAVYLEGGLGVRIPFARAINPVTGTNWEGQGVLPHVRVPAEQALDRALQLARKALASEG